MAGFLVNLIVYLLIIGILLALVYYVLDHIPVPDPLNRIIKIVIVVLAVLVIVLLLLQFVGGGGVNLPRIGT